MAQSMHHQAISERLLDRWQLESQPNAELADCIAFPDPHHFNNVVGCLEQEAFQGGADFVGK